MSKLYSKQINISKGCIYNSAFTASKTKWTIYKNLEIDGNLVAKMLNNLVNIGKLKITSKLDSKITKYKK